ncbi:MAG: hypothetical protein WD468_05095, partial [Pirellulales bacterium]
MSPEEVHERRLADLRRFTRAIREQEPLHVIKFNDGEWHAMAGRGGANCDNHKYSGRLQKEMRSAYRELRSSAFISDYIVNHSMHPQHNRLAEKIGLPRNWFVNFAMLHHRPYRGRFDCRTHELKEFYRAIRDDPRMKIFIGPKRLQPDVFLQTTQRIDVPMSNAFDVIGRLSVAATSIAKQVSPVFLTSCGFSSCILARDILRVNPSATVIDLGSALDPILFGITRSAQLSTQELRDFYSDFGCDWPRMPHFYASIPGGFNFADVYAEMVDRFGGGQFVEVGSW